MSLMLIVKSVALLALATTPADAGSGALERALAERACGMAAYSSITQTDDDGSCVSRRLAALRADFGPGLSELSARERRSVDSTCGRLNTPLSRETYLDCLNAQIVGLRALRNTSGQVRDAAQPRFPPAAAPAPESREPAPTTMVVALLIGAAVLAASAVWWILRARRSQPSATSAASA